MDVWRSVRLTAGMAVLAGTVLSAPSLLVAGEKISPTVAALASVVPAVVAVAGVSTWFSRPSRRRVRPFLLPPPPTVFVGRGSQLAAIYSGLERTSSRVPRVVVITGAAGVGKTALALTAAHATRARYADGQLFARMSSGHPMLDSVADVLASFVAALQGPHDRLPVDGAELATEYRRLTAHRRILVVLDDLGVETDIAPLLPSGPDSAVVVTATRGLAVGPSFTEVALEPLNDDQAIDLLSALLGPNRVDASFDGVSTLVPAAAGHPLALHVVAAALARRPNWRLDRILRTSNSGGPVTAATDAVPGLSAMDVGYALLSAQERRAAEVLGVFQWLTFEPWMLAAALSSPGAYRHDERVKHVGEEMAVHLAQRLVDARLVERLPDREGEFPVFRIEDYVHQYAGVCRRRSFSPDDDQLAREAIFDEAERRRHADQGESVDSAVNTLLAEGRLGDALNVAREGLEVAEFTAPQLESEALLSDRSQAQGLNADREHAHAALAVVYTELGDNDNALYFARRAGVIADRPTQARVLHCRGVLFYRSRNLAAADQCLAAAAETADAGGGGLDLLHVLRDWSVVKALSADSAGMGLARKAIELASREDRVRKTSTYLLGLWAWGAYLLAANLAERADQPLGEAQTIASIRSRRLWEAWIGEHRARAALQSRRGGSTAAREHAYRSAELFGAMRHRYGVAFCRLTIGRSYVADANYNDALPALAEALETFVNCGDRWIEAQTATELALALVASKSDRRREAELLLHGAARTFADLGDRQSAAKAFAAASRAMGDPGIVSLLVGRGSWLVRSFVPDLGRSGT